MQLLTILAGIAWDPEIRGILTVLLGFTILGGSVYTIVATNTGARLGLLLSLAGLFGWLVVLTTYWWISPPGIGPRGDGAVWHVVEVAVDGSSQPETKAVQTLPRPGDLPTAADILAANPDLAAEFTGDPVLSDIAGVDTSVLPTKDELGGWTILSTAGAGEAQAVADLALVEEGLFEDSSGYRKLNAFEKGGKPKRTDECPDDGDKICRAVYRVKKTFMFKHPTRYAVVQVQPVVAQEAIPGSPPPPPIIDESKPVISVIMERDLGTVRLKPAVFWVVSTSLFVVFVLILHFRDKTLQQNLEAAEAVAKAAT